MPANQFPKTSWTLIDRAGAPLSPEGREALASFYKGYRFPVYAFIRRSGGSPEEADDRTQGFFASLIERNDLAKLDRTRGSKFRSWLLTCVRNYLENQRKFENAQRRPPRKLGESLDDDAAEGRYRAELSCHLTPERLYERHFTLTLLARVLDALRAKYTAAGEVRRFEALKGYLSGCAEQRPYTEVAATLGMNVGAVKKAVFDLRKRYDKQLRAEVAYLVEDPDDAAQVKKELRDLLAALED